MPSFKYQSDGFPEKYGASCEGTQTCTCTWAEIVWAAITVGKRERLHLTQFGMYSSYELIYREFVVRANIKSDPSDELVRTEAYTALDPSEKGAISYFLGLTMAKLLSEKYLNTPWLMHVDVYKTFLRPIFRTKKRVRPDLVGHDTSGDWIGFEAKGRTGANQKDLLENAKKQTEHLRSVRGQLLSLRVASVTYFVNDRLTVTWRDPEGFNKDARDLEVSLDAFLKKYYEPFVMIFTDREFVDGIERIEVEGNSIIVARIPGADIAIGLIDSILEAYDSNTLETLSHKLPRLSLESGKFTESVIQGMSFSSAFLGKDGIFVQLGAAWDKSNMSKEPRQRAVTEIQQKNRQRAEELM